VIRRPPHRSEFSCAAEGSHYLMVVRDGGARKR